MFTCQNWQPFSTNYDIFDFTIKPKLAETALLVSDRSLLSTPRIHSEASKDSLVIKVVCYMYTATCCAEGVHSLISRPSTPPVVDRLQ